MLLLPWGIPCFPQNQAKFIGHRSQKKPLHFIIFTFYAVRDLICLPTSSHVAFPGQICALYCTHFAQLSTLKVTRIKSSLSF